MSIWSLALRWKTLNLIESQSSYSPQFVPNDKMRPEEAEQPERRTEQRGLTKWFRRAFTWREQSVKNIMAKILPFLPEMVTNFLFQSNSKIDTWDPGWVKLCFIACYEFKHEMFWAKFTNYVLSKTVPQHNVLMNCWENEQLVQLSPKMSWFVAFQEDPNEEMHGVRGHRVTGRCQRIGCEKKKKKKVQWWRMTCLNTEEGVEDDFGCRWENQVIGHSWGAKCPTVGRRQINITGSELREELQNMGKELLRAVSQKLDSEIQDKR